VPVEFDHLRVVLVDARNPLNIGAAARAMSNFGFRHLRVVNPYDVAFEGARSAVGAAEVLSSAEKYETVADAVADCSLVVGTTAIGHRDLQHSIQRLEAAAPLIRAHLASGPCALLFGSEKFGLSNQDMSHCHWLMHIPTREEHFSMNLGGGDLPVRIDTRPWSGSGAGEGNAGLGRGGRTNYRNPARGPARQRLPKAELVRFF